MPNFAILRLGKLRTQAAVSNAGAHNHRTRPQRNANPRLSPLNCEFVVSELSIPEHVNFLLAGKKFRKDAVLASELVLTASPAFFDDNQKLRAWTDLNVQWLKKQHGDNLVSCVLHLDESTPHLHAVIVPICPDGKLACKRYWGGPAELIELQTDYAKVMEPLGLSRGVEGSNRPTSATVARWRGAQAATEAMQPHRAIPSPKLPSPPPLPNRFSLATMTPAEWMDMFRSYGKRCLRRATSSYQLILEERDTVVEQYTAQSLLAKQQRPRLKGKGEAPNLSFPQRTMETGASPAGSRGRTTVYTGPLGKPRNGPRPPL